MIEIFKNIIKYGKNNRMKPSLGQLVKMANALDINVTKLINHTKE